MSEANAKPEGGRAASGEPLGREESADEVAATMAACCGPEMAQMMEGCACASAMKGHWKTALLAFGLVLLVFLTTFVGGILGIIAFFRSL